MFVKSLVPLLPGVLLLSAGGGVADSVTKPQLALHVTRQGKVLRDYNLAVAVRLYDHRPFFGSQQIVTDAAGAAHVQFATMWSSAFFIPPPLGNVPSRPPKPVYAMTAGTGQIIVSPEIS